MKSRDLLKKFLVESLSEMKLDVAGAQGFDTSKPRTSFDVSVGPGPSPIVDLGAEEGDACPECGGGPEACDPMCPIGGEGDMGPDPDRFRN